MRLTERFVDRGFLNSALADPTESARGVAPEFRENYCDQIDRELKRLAAQREKLLECRRKLAGKG